MNRVTPFTPRLLAVLLAAGLASAAQAQEATWSGFGTLGYAVSNSDYTYQGSINRQGSFRRDSLLAGQLDLRLNPQWSATVQMKISPADNSDNRWQIKPAWAFVAWRPDNDWLVRAGKTRLPLYLYSESLDVGVANDMARLPQEMYSIAPTNDFRGLFISRSLALGEQDLTLDAFVGEADATARLWVRDGLPPFFPAGPVFKTVNVKVNGLVLSGRGPQLTWRLALLNARERTLDGHPLPVRYPRVDVGPGISYWKVDESQPGPAILTAPRIRNQAITAGAEWQIGAGWRLAAEYVNMHQYDTELGSDSRAGYVALFKRMGAFTPYVSLARQRSSDGVLDWRLRLTTPSVPAAVPGAAQLNATQRIAGELGYAFDQSSQALGLSYALSPTARLKGEWMRTRIGAASGHFDAPPGQPDAANMTVNTLSVNLSIAF